MKYFVFSIHNHQPVGNFSHVIGNSFERAYRPFLERLAQRRNIRAVLHISGYLLDWIEKNKPSCIGLIRGMVERGQLELLGGGYYEPVLAVIPPEDRIAQIRLMTERLRTLFGTEPRGMWLAERVWDPTLPPYLKEAGMDYVVVDDHHFIKAGLKEKDVKGYYVTEDRGVPVRVFGGSERLRYLIPFEKVEALETYLKEGEEGLFVFADDGEKFGIWPGTERWVYEEGWLESFFDWLEANSGWLKTTTFSEYIEIAPPRGRIYLPPVSYMEMEEWALPAEASAEYARVRKEFEDGGREDVLRFLQGGYWRNFLWKYPEADWMHKRMLLLSRRLNSMDAPPQEALRHLYMAQCNDAYWHGVFGGLYLQHLRFSVYENIIKAETLVEAVEGVSVEVEDIDGDTEDEVVIKTPSVALFLSPQRGGSLIELDFRPKAVNLLNVLSRWQEGYHARVKSQRQQTDKSEVKSIHHEIKVKKGVHTEELVFDRERRLSLVDSFIDETLKGSEYFCGKASSVERLGSEPYLFEKMADGVRLERNTRWGRLEKRVTVEGESTVRFCYLLSKTETLGIAHKRLAVEFNMCMPSGCGADSFYLVEGKKMSLSSSAELEGIDRFHIEDRGCGLRVGFSFSSPVAIWLHPVETVSLSESGLERNYQGSTVVLVLPVEYIVDGEFSILNNIETL